MFSRPSARTPRSTQPPPQDPAPPPFVTQHSRRSRAPPLVHARPPLPPSRDRPAGVDSHRCPRLPSLTASNSSSPAPAATSPTPPSPSLSPISPTVHPVPNLLHRLPSPAARLTYRASSTACPIVVAEPLRRSFPPTKTAARVSPSIDHDHRPEPAEPATSPAEPACPDRPPLAAAVTSRTSSTSTASRRRAEPSVDSSPRLLLRCAEIAAEPCRFVR